MKSLNPPTLTLPQRLIRLWPFYRAAKRGFAVAALAAVIAAVTEPLLPGLMQPLLDKGFKPGGFSLWLVPAALLALFALRGVAAFSAEYALAWAGQRGTHALRTSMFEHLLSAKPQALAPLSASSLANTLVYETQTGSAMLVAAINSLIRNGLIVVALAGYLVWLNWQLSLFVLVTFPPVAWVMRRLSRRLHRFATQSQAATDELAYVVEENAAAAQVVRVHGAQASQTLRFSNSSLTLQKLAIKATASSAAMTPITQFMVAIPLSAVIAIALWQAQASTQTVGSFTAFVMGMLMLIAPIKHLADIAGPITRGLAAVERGLTLMHDLAVESGGHHKPEVVRGDIRLEAVSYRHPPRDTSQQAPLALEEIHLHVAAGMSLALVGPSGAGKSTLVNLLPRFIEPHSGSIQLDGVPIQEWDLAYLRSQFALVSQHTVLFNDSIAANVSLGAQLDDARVKQALEAAHLWSWTQSLPQGTDTVIGHNALSLSGGQRQRLAIARAIYKRAKVVLLDEATAALDNESERHVQAALETLMGHCTTIVIAHRLSTIQHCNCIAVMDQGRILELGPHSELLAQGGLYARLHQLQFTHAAASAPNL